MARSLNKVNLIGNVGADPDIRTTSSGARIGKLSLATSRTFTDRSGHEQERTQWHRLTFFGKLVDVVEQWVGKGDRLYVEGRLEYSQTEDDHGGTRYWTDIIVYELIMLGSSRGGDNSSSAAPAAASSGRAPSPAQQRPITEPDDDLPF